MGSKKHTRGRDLPHARVKSITGTWVPHPGRVAKGDGTSWPAHGVAAGVVPKRPPICMFYDDIGDPMDGQPAPVFGMYPSSFIGKMLPWLRCERREVLHVCSGGLPRGEGLRVDLRPEAKPDLLADGRHLPLRDGSMAAVMLDPPYTEHYANELYGVEYPLPSHLLNEAARVVRPGGRIVFVHYFTPNPPKRPACRFVRGFGMSMGFGYPWRAVSIYERAQDDLFAAPGDALGTEVSG